MNCPFQQAAVVLSPFIGRVEVVAAGVKWRCPGNRDGGGVGDESMKVLFLDESGDHADGIDQNSLRRESTSAYP